MKTAKKTIVTELLTQFPKAATRTLARKLRKEHPRVFSSFEEARTSLRYYRGASGDASRKKLAERKFIRPKMTASQWYAQIPAGRVQFDNWGPVAIAGPAKVLVVPDAHVPYHDTAALKLCLQYGAERRADVVLFNGDTCDCFSISRWEKDPRERNFAGEIKTIKELMAVTRGLFPKARIIFREGNHEYRFQDYMFTQAPELLDIPEFSFPAVLDLAGIGAEWVAEKRPITLGKLNTLHGHEYRFAISNPVNPARGYYLRAKAHVLGAHFHQTSQHSEKTLEGNVISTWSTGCLCDLHPAYLPINNWNHGFAFCEVDKDGAFAVENLRIIDGRVY